MNETIGLIEGMSTTRSIRRFRSDPIPDELLRSVLTAATWAPIGSNSQGWRLLVVQDPEKRRQLTQYGIEVTGLVPLVVGVGADNEGYLSAKRDRMGHELPDSITSAPVFTTLEGRTA